MMNRLGLVLACALMLTLFASGFALAADDSKVNAATEQVERGAKKIRIENLAFAAKKRAATTILASPKWRDRDKIKAIYEEARRLTVETGVVHHVDHYYPLQGLLCSGLHVHHNLRVMPASENCSKGNGQPLEDSPATAAFIKQYGVTGLRVWLKWAKEGIK